MPYTETHEIVIGPITLPAGVRVEVQTVVATGGQQSVTIVGTTPTSKADTEALLQVAFAQLIVAATAEDVGEPVFVSPTPAPAPSPTASPVTQ